MEQTWGRADHFLDLTLDKINSLITPCVADSAVLLAEGHANTNYKITFGGGQIAVLKLYQREPDAAPLERAIAELFSEKPWMPAPLFHGPSFSASEWKPGKSFQASSQEEMLSAAADIGAALRDISSIQFSEAGFLTVDGSGLRVGSAWPSAIDGYLGYLDMCLARPALPERIGQDLSERIASRIRDSRQELLDLSGTACLTHGDYKASNILIYEGRLSAILDWEFAHSGCWLLSAGQILRHADELPAGFADAFLGGFGIPKKDRNEVHRLARILDLVNLVDFLGREHSNPGQIEHLIRLIEAVL